MIMLHTHTQTPTNNLPPLPNNKIEETKKMLMYSVFIVVVPRAGFDCQYNGFSMLCSLT